MITLLATHMEMVRPPAGDAVAAPIAGAEVTLERLDANAYLDLYRRVGTPVQWDSRLKTPIVDLVAWLADPSTCIHVLRVDGQAAGLCEFCGVGGPEVELAHFGLDPTFHGKRLGPFLLDAALRSCWSNTPSRIWLRTDTNDHAAAIGVYEKAGFVTVRRQIEEFED